MNKLILILILLPFLGFSQFVKENSWGFYNDHEIEAFTKDNDGNLLMIAKTQIYNSNIEYSILKKVQGVFQMYEAPTNLTNNGLKHIKCDAYGNIWVGSESGLAVFNGFSWFYPNFEDNYDIEIIKDMEIAENGAIWLATPFGIRIYNGFAFYSYNTSDGLSSNNITCLSKDINGVMWIGTVNGLCRFDDPGFTVYTSDDGLSSNNIKKLEANEDVFVYCSNDLIIYNGENFETIEIELPESIGSNNLKIIESDENNDIWMLYNYDLLKIHNAEIELIINSKNSGLSSSNSCLAVIDSNVFVGGAYHSYYYSTISALSPENLLLNIDTLNVNNQEYWMRFDGLNSDIYNQKSSVIIGGINENNELKLSGSVWNNMFVSDYGPIPTGYNSVEYVSNYEKIWKVYQNQIDFHISNWNTIGYQMPMSIKAWPEISEFEDVNSNSVYDPENGDYPIIRGDLAILSISNDLGNMGLEKHDMSYAYTSSDSALNNTVFTNYKIINKSGQNYHSVYCSIYDDMNIGGPEDDYVGTDTALNAVYFYNATNEDEVYASGSIPARALVFLNSKMSSSAYFTNPVEDFYTMGYPSSKYHYHNYLRGFWKDGSAMTYGGNACGGDSAVNYVFTGDPLNGTGWNEMTVGNLEGDRRVFAVIGPFDLEDGEEICIDIARVEGTAWESTHLMSIKELRNRVSHIHSWYGNQDYICDSLIAQPSVDLTAEANDLNVVFYETINVFLQVLVGGGTYPYSFEWFDESGDLISELSSPEVTLSNEETYYYVIVTDTLGNTAADTLNLHPILIPEVDLGNDTSICYGDTLELSIPYNVPCSWNNGSEDSLIYVYESGYYSIAIFPFGLYLDNWHGDSIYIEVIRPEVNFLDITTACLDEEVELSVYDYPEILWNTGETTSEILLNTSEITAEYYSVFVTDSNGCSNKDSTLFVVNPLPNVDLGNDLVILDTASVLLNAYVGHGAEYDWSTGQDSYSILFNGEIGEGDYEVGVEITDISGCVGSGNVHIHVDLFVGLDENGSYTLNIYPNPSSDYMNIELLKASNYNLIDEKGLVIKTGKFHSKGNILQVSDLRPGTYFLDIRSLNLRKKIIIN